MASPLSSTPFASSGVTSSNLDNIKKRLTNLNKKVANGFSNVKKANPLPTPTLGVSPIVSGLSNIIPPTSTIDMESIFPKTGGARKKTRRTRRAKKARRARK